MADDRECPTCGGQAPKPAGNVVFLSERRLAAPPRVDALELPDGRFRLNINLVVSRAAAIRVLASLQDGD